MINIFFYYLKKGMELYADCFDASIRFSKLITGMCSTQMWRHSHIRHLTLVQTQIQHTCLQFSNNPESVHLSMFRCVSLTSELNSAVHWHGQLIWRTPRLFLLFFPLLFSFFYSISSQINTTCTHTDTSNPHCSSCACVGSGSICYVSCYHAHAKERVVQANKLYNI